MGLLESFGSSLKKDDDFKDAQKARKIQRILDERDKSSNERVLEKFNEERRQEIIKKKIDGINKRKNDMLFNKKFVPDKNIFGGKSNMLSSDNSILKSDKNLLAGGNMFFK